MPLRPFPKPSTSKYGKSCGQNVTLRWPACPYRINIPKRHGNQYILITKTDRQDHGDRAEQLALAVCTQMIAWLQKLPQGSLIDQRHWEHGSYGEGTYAEGFSIFLDLRPADVRVQDLDVGYLDRELAYFAMEEFRDVVKVFGALEGEFEVHAFGYRRARVAMHILAWPADGGKDTG
ncbi:MAG: hypothetical protein LQ346_007841 [Caloplaca aetnensis]|nr:MAG: hypothetical protein LQ346_007841 [Caloplaca aetnensis]